MPLYLVRYITHTSGISSDPGLAAIVSHILQFIAAAFSGRCMKEGERNGEGGDAVVAVS